MPKVKVDGKLKKFSYTKKGKEAAKRVKKKAIKTASDVMTAPKRFKVNRKIKSDSRKLSTIRDARAFDNAPDFNSDGTVTKAFKTRTMSRKFLDDFRKRNK